MMERGPAADRLTLAHADAYKNRAASFALISQQYSGAMNPQHDQTYLSPAKGTTIRHVATKRHRSEILTYGLGCPDWPRSLRLGVLQEGLMP